MLPTISLYQNLERLQVVEHKSLHRNKNIGADSSKNGQSEFLQF